MGDWPLRHHARPHAFLLQTGTRCEATRDLRRVLERMDEQAIKRQLRLTTPVWQEEFFDHVLRSSESYSEKWNYVRNNPLRHGLIANADDWPWQGQIEELRL